MFKTAQDKRNSEDGFFTSNEVAAAARVTLRMLQWWDERGIIAPRHQGHKRFYTQAELIQVVVLGALRRKAFTLQEIRRYNRQLQRAIAQRCEINGANWFVIASKQEALVCDSERAVLDVLCRSDKPWAVISIDREVNRNALAARSTRAV